ncbi:hypothetical protein ACFFX0_19095 [Citricoccus parietis]|uniref:Uncharacterized protein n=1 Tax=Citricoccus parietis TaxID=592307 RepID=A0ABV5G2N2_9MICC
MGGLGPRARRADRRRAGGDRAGVVVVVAERAAAIERGGPLPQGASPSALHRESCPRLGSGKIKAPAV